MRQILASTVLLLGSLPAVAQERWSHAASGASFPMTFDTQSIADRRDLGTSNDSVVNYEAATGTESTTLYIFKASVPNARLWFDRAMPIVASQIPMAIFEAGPLEKIAAFSATSPNALRQIFVAKQAGPFKSTALVVAQSGPWIVKVRATSATLDRTGLATRIDRHLAAIRIAAPAFAAGVDSPVPCSAAPQMGSGKHVVSGVEQAAVFAIAVHARLHADASQFCVADAPNARFTMLGVKGQPTSWLLLIGDAGKAIGSETMSFDKAITSHLVYVSTPTATRGAAVFDAPPSLEAAAGVAAPLLRDAAAGLFAISTSASDRVEPKVD